MSTFDPKRNIRSTCCKILSSKNIVVVRFCSSLTPQWVSNYDSHILSETLDNQLLQVIFYVVALVRVLVICLISDTENVYYFQSFLCRCIACTAHHVVGSWLQSTQVRIEGGRNQNPNLSDFRLTQILVLQGKPESKFERSAILVYSNLHFWFTSSTKWNKWTRIWAKQSRVHHNILGFPIHICWFEI